MADYFTTAMPCFEVDITICLNNGFINLYVMRLIDKDDNVLTLQALTVLVK